MADKPDASDDNWWSKLAGFAREVYSITDPNVMYGKMYNQYLSHTDDPEKAAELARRGADMVSSSMGRNKAIWTGMGYMHPVTAPAMIVNQIQEAANAETPGEAATAGATAIAPNVAGKNVKAPTMARGATSGAPVAAPGYADGGDVSKALSVVPQAPEADPVGVAKSVMSQPRPEAMKLSKPPQEPPSAYFEIAPGEKWDAGLKQRWEALHPQAKAAVSNRMIGDFMSRWQRETGIQGEVKPGLGGFEGYTNPNYTFQPYNPDHIMPALTGLGELFHQDSMMGASAKPFKGGEKTGVIRVNLPKGLSPDEVHEIYKNLNDKGLALGHSTDVGNGYMDITGGDGGKETVKIAKAIDQALGGQYDVDGASKKHRYLH